MNRVLERNGSVILVEVTGADLTADVDDLRAASAAIGWIVKVVAGVIVRVDEVAADSDEVHGQTPGKGDLISVGIRVRVIPLELLWPGSVDIGQTVMQPADVHEPGEIFQLGLVVEVDVFASVQQAHFVDVVLVVIGVGEGTVEARVLLAVQGAARCSIEGDAGDRRGGNHLSAVTGAVGEIAAEVEAALLKSFDGLAVDGEVLARAAEAVGTVAVIVAHPAAAGEDGRPAFVHRAGDVELKILLVIAAVGEHQVAVKLVAGLQRREFDRAADVGVPAVERVAGPISDGGILDDLHLGDGGRLPQPGCGIDNRNAIERNAQACAAGIAAVAAPTLIDSIERNGVLGRASVAVAGYARSGSEGNHLGRAGYGSEHVHLGAVDDAESLVRQKHIALRWLRRSAEKRAAVDDDRLLDGGER